MPNPRWFGCALGILIVTGCRQRAYTELYVESMASEVRMLEDRVYEFDAAYGEIEQENDELRKLNADLRQKLDTLRSANSSSPGQTLPNGSYSVPSVLNPRESIPETIENPPVVSRSPVAPPTKKNELDKSNSPPPSGLMPKEDESFLPPPNTPAKPPANGQTDAPRASLRTPSNQRSNAPFAAENLTEQVTMPESMVRSAQQPKLLTPTPPPIDPTTRKPLRPINPPPLLPKAFPFLKDGNSKGAIDRSRIPMPEGSKVQFASALESVPKPENHRDSNEAVPEVTDMRLVEIAFHPTLCRGHNFDQKPGDDGLYLVVTPLNAAGQVVNLTGTLTAVVEDPSLPTEKARIAAWKWTPDQLGETLEPIGTAQGFHLSVPWQKDPPSGRSVMVYLNYAREDGRTLRNQREIQLRKSTASQSVWTPR